MFFWDVLSPVPGRGWAVRAGSELACPDVREREREREGPSEETQTRARAEGEGDTVFISRREGRKRRGSCDAAKEDAVIAGSLDPGSADSGCALWLQ